MNSGIFNSYTDPIPPLRFDVQIIPIKQNGETYLYFQDPMGYATGNFAVPYSAQSIFSLFNGSRSVEDILEYSVDGITKEQILEYVQFLDENALLHSEYFQDHAEKTESAYEESEIHQSITAGLSYPEDPGELKHFLEEAFGKLPTSEPDSNAKALYAPHIDIRHGLSSYVKAFSAIKDLEPKRVVIFATSHYSGMYPEVYDEFPFMISKKNFEMINGTVKTDRNGIGEIEERIGDDGVDYGITFQDRAHRIEHSIEMHLLFLNHIWKHDFEIVPILVGSLDELFYKEDGFRGQQVEKFSGLMNEIFRDHINTFFLISGDLAHVGKNFGDQQPAKKMFEKVRNFDESFLDFGTAADPGKMLSLISKKYDPYRTCGYPPLYTFLRSISNLKGEILTYDIWDEKERESGVSFGSILYT